MFKAKLVENDRYYGLRRNQLILSLLATIPIALVSNFFYAPVWAVILGIVLYILTSLLVFKNLKAIKAVSEHRIIEIDEDQIRLKSKDKITRKTIPLEKVDQIILKQDYSLPQETMSDVAQEIKGKSIQNFIIVEKNSQQQKFDFILDSYYMLTQLEKLTEHWLAKGFPIKRI